MTDAQSINAAARIRQMIDLTRRLTERLATECAAFEARRPQDVAGGLAETQEMANIYRRESAQLKADPGALKAALATDRMQLIEATRAFEAVLARHAAAVEAARVISEGLVKTIAAEISSQRGAPSAYGANGHANGGEARAVAYNRAV